MLLLIASANTKLLGVEKPVEQKERLFHVKTVQPKKYVKKHFHQSELGDKEAIRFQSPSMVKRSKANNS